MRGTLRRGPSALWPTVLLLSFALARTTRGEPPQDAAAVVKERIASHKVQIFSKSYCPFCKNSKAIFDDLKVEYHADELDQMPDGAAIQDELAKMTGQRTVPSIFIGGVHVGGNDSLEHAKSAGKLPKLFESAGINREL